MTEGDADAGAEKLTEGDGVTDSRRERGAPHDDEEESSHQNPPELVQCQGSASACTLGCAAKSLEE